MARQLVAPCLVLALWALLAGEVRGESRASYGETLIASLLEEPLQIDPLEARTHTDLSLARLLFDTLYRVDTDGSLQPHLAAALPDESNPLRIRIPLLAGVSFHNGRQLRAQDVRASLERVRKSEWAPLVATIKAIEIEEVAPVAAAEESNAAPQEVLVLVMRQADARLAHTLADPRLSIVERGQAPNWRRLNGTGPFRFVSRSAQSARLVLEAHDAHFAGRAFLSRLVLRWFDNKDAEARYFESGQQQISLRGAVAFAGHRPKFASAELTGEASILVYLGFTTETGLVGDREFRSALSLAMRRDAMKQIGTGERVVPATSPVPASRLLGRDAQAASRLMLEVSRRHDDLNAGRARLKVCVNRSRPDDAEVAARVADTLFTYGIQTTILPLEARSFSRSLKRRECELFIGQLAISTQDAPEEVWQKVFVASGDSKILASMAPGKRSEAALQKRFEARWPLVPLYHRAVQVSYRNDLYGVQVQGDQRIAFEDISYFGVPEKN